MRDFFCPSVVAVSSVGEAARERTSEVSVILANVCHNIHQTPFLLLLRLTLLAPSSLHTLPWDMLAAATATSVAAADAVSLT